MEHKLFSSSKSRPSRSNIQVDDDVHFVLDNNKCFPTPSPRKPFEQQQNPYSKKIPVIYQPVASPAPPEIYNVKDKLHSSLILNSPSVPSGKKNVPRKRKTESDLEGLNCSVATSPKLQKFKSMSQMNNARVYNRPVRNGPMKFKRESSPSSSDSDIEIVAIKVTKVTRSVTTTETKPFAQNMRKLINAQPVFNNSFRKGSIKSDPSSKEMLVNEADTAPFMPTNPNMFADVGNRVNSMRWLSANGTISVAGGSSHVLGGKCEASTPPIVIPPEIKVENEKPKVHRELKGLYANLNEISWTHEKSFQKLLQNPDYLRHSERSTAVKNMKQEKDSSPAERSKRINLMKVKKPPSPVSVAAQKKSRIARLSPTMKTKLATKKRILSKITTEKANTKPAVKKGVAKSNATNTPVAKSEDGSDEADEVNVSDEDDQIKYKFAPSFLKKIAGEAKGKANTSKAKPEVIEAKEVTKPVTQKGKTISKSDEKTKPGVKKTNPLGQKAENNRHKPQPNRPDGITNIPFSMPIIIDDSSPSTSGTQSPVCSGRNAPSGASASDMSSFLSNIDFTVSKEMQLMQALGGNGDLYSAVQRGSKLRVCLEPLEQTDYWNNDFYDEFRKHMLRQAIRKAFDNRDHESVTEMYHELLESFNPNQPSSNGNSKVLKKKKPDEETLRISVRQSEGAFRYKEIVVKKHPSYMQVVLVPNTMKHNSLSNEALRELKEAFLLAKKDPNCRAVLLNSSGSYFCSGIELSSLVGSNKRQASEEMATSIRDLVLTLGFFTKPIIAAVNGDCLGFGVAILTFCDIVLASDKATFSIPATKLGYMPEGAITLTLPQAVGSVVASEMLLQGRRLTAEQALRCGLVSEVLWPTRLMNEVVPRLKNVISQPLSAMEATKTMVRCHLWDKLRSHLDRERRILLEHWQSSPCQNNIKTLLQTGWLTD